MSGRQPGDTPDGPMASGPAAGGGDRRVADVDHDRVERETERGPGGPRGSQDASDGGIAEAGD